MSIPPLLHKKSLRDKPRAILENLKNGGLADGHEGVLKQVNKQIYENKVLKL